MNNNNHVKAGYRCFTGAVITEAQAVAYNSLTDKIESFKKAGLEVPEYLLNGRYNYFLAIAYSKRSV